MQPVELVLQVYKHVGAEWSYLNVLLVHYLLAHVCCSLSYAIGLVPEKFSGNEKSSYTGGV